MRPALFSRAWFASLSFLTCAMLGAWGPPAQAAEASNPASAAMADATARPGEVRYVQANGLKFAYLEEGQGPLVLLLHGYPETARSWSAVQHQLAQAGYRVVAPFMRGYPPTEAGTDYTLSTLANDVLGLIDALGQGPAIVVGHDWGAAAAYGAAAQAPARLSHLVALAFPHPRAIANDLVKVFIEAPHFVYYQFPWAESLVSASNFAHLDRLYHLWSPGYAPPAEVMNDIKDTLRQPGATSNALGYYRGLLRAGPAAISAAGKTTIATPTLVIAGVDDKPAQLAHFEQARPAFTGPYSFVKLDGVGHFPQLEAPGRTAQAILTFLAPPP